MYDFWFTLGRAIMQPGDLIAVIKAYAYFERLKERDLVETDQAGVQTTIPNTTTAGFIRSKETTAVRNAIRQYYLKTSPGAPPTSIFTAGRLTQLLLIPGIYFEANVLLAHEAYHDALKGTPEKFSNGFVAFLGLCLVDSKVTAWFKDPEDPDLLDALDEFGLGKDLGTPELQVITRTITDGRFLKAQAALLDGEGWPDGCKEQFRFWEGKNERAMVP